MTVWAWIFVLMCFCVGSSHAAEIKVLAAQDGGAVIVLVGRIELDDGARFASTASGADRAVVLFDSPGGNLLAGLRIGQFIRLHSFGTLVPDGAHCASACALAWLGGSRRMLQPTGQVGFHSAYIRDANGLAHETGAGNALVGAYLSRLGLSDEAILYVERASPNDMTWLRERDAKKLGIDVSIIPSFEREKSPTMKETPPVQDKQPQDMKLVAVEFVGKYFAHWSESNADAIAFFRSVYFQRVDFYGQAVPFPVVIEQKAKFADRWPERLYAVRADTVHADCAATGCDVTGVVDWDARSSERRQRSAGSAKFHLQLRFMAGKPIIVSESGMVLSRESEDPPIANKEQVGATKSFQ